MVEEGQHIIQLEELFPFVHTITPHLFVIIVVECIIIVDVFVEERKNVISLLLTMTITEEEYVATTGAGNKLCDSQASRYYVLLSLCAWVLKFSRL